MDRRERYQDEEEALRMAMRALQTRLWTALPGIVTEFNNERMTVNVQPVVNGRLLDPDTGLYSSVKMPILLDCPVLWLGGGGVTATFPIAVGDECLVIFSARCIDAWWQLGVQSGRIPDPLSYSRRMHNLSDGFALVGVRSLPKAFTVDTANAALITDDGETYFKLNPTTKAINVQAAGGFNVTATAGITLNGVTIDSSGNLTTAATLTGTTDVVAAGISGKGHVHPGVQSGGSNTGTPTG